MSGTAAVTETVRKATEKDAGRLAATLSTAFFDDPVMSWCYPDPEARGRLLTDSFRVVIDATLAGGGIDTVADEVAGAIWVPPDAEIDEDQMAIGLGEMSGDYRERLFTLIEVMDDKHPQDPHQYLFVLGTRPQWQSRGIGSALLRSVLDPCDRDGVPAYLEATSERNRDLYARHGFEVTETVTLPAGPPLWCMWRTPKT